jgi:hypothetical protein
VADIDSRLQDLSQRIGIECKNLRGLLNGNVSDLSALTTNARGSLVAAINELKTELHSIESSGGATVNDQSVASNTQVWSINRVLYELAQTSQAVDTGLAQTAQTLRGEISQASTALKAEILGGAAPAYDTLMELKGILDGEATTLTTVLLAVSNRVRFDTDSQGLTTQQRFAARKNIGAIGMDELGDTSADIALVFSSALAAPSPVPSFGNIALDLAGVFASALE